MLTTTTTNGGTTDPPTATYTISGGSSVEVAAIPEACYALDHWELDGNNVGSANPYSVIMDSNHTLHAVFIQPEYDLTIAATSGGTTEPAPGIYTYGCGSIVEVNAIPDANYAFDHWELNGNDVGSDCPYSVVVDGDHTLHAVFFPLLIITATSGGTTAPPPGTYSYPSGSVVEVTAIPELCCELDHWELDGNSVDSNNPYLVVMDSNHTLHAVLFRAKACFPHPADEAKDVPTDVVLSWEPGVDANSHDVYFGTDYNDVNDANSSWPAASGPNDPNVYKGRQDANNYDPPGLELGQTYYWRIDEVNGPNVWKGTTWEFMVNHTIVDDMEDYNDMNNAIWDTWKDWQWNDTGSWVDLGIDPCHPIHGGTQSMVYMYDNSGWPPSFNFYSEIEANTVDLEVGPDWTAGGLKALTLYFYGDPNNDANDTEQMYMALQDANGRIGVVEYDGDMNDTKIVEWQEWNIELQDFNDINNVDLTDVNQVYIGFGVRGNNTLPGGSGVVYFDDIRLYLPRCVLQYVPEGAAELTDDCIVDYVDLKTMAEEWLTSGVKADLVDDDNVNFEDFAILADDWLKNFFWP
jgi:hypothetical protein